MLLGKIREARHKPLRRAGLGNPSPPFRGALTEFIITKLHTAVRQVVLYLLRIKQNQNTFPQYERTGTYRSMVKKRLHLLRRIPEIISRKKLNSILFSTFHLSSRRELYREKGVIACQPSSAGLTILFFFSLKE